MKIPNEDVLMAVDVVEQARTYCKENLSEEAFYIACRIVAASIDFNNPRLNKSVTRLVKSNVRFFEGSEEIH